MLLSGLNMILEILGLVLYGFYPEVFLEFLEDTVNIAVGISAIIAIRGITQLKINELHQYTVARILSIPAGILFAVLQVVVDPDEEFEEPNSRLFLGMMVMIFLIGNILRAKVVWSADVRIQNNEAVLVLHGMQVVQLMQKQSDNLAHQNIVYVGAGQEIN